MGTALAMVVAVSPTPHARLTSYAPAARRADQARRRTMARSQAAALSTPAEIRSCRTKEEARSFEVDGSAALIQEAGRLSPKRLV
jgi:hypothetical protein